MPTKHIGIIGYGGAGFAQAITELEAQNISYELHPDIVGERLAKSLEARPLNEIIEDDKLVKMQITPRGIDDFDFKYLVEEKRSVIPPFYGKRDKYGFRKKKK